MSLDGGYNSLESDLSLTDIHVHNNFYLCHMVQTTCSPSVGKLQLAYCQIGPACCV